MDFKQLPGISQRTLSQERRKSMARPRSLSIEDKQSTAIACFQGLEAS